MISSPSPCRVVTFGEIMGRLTPPGFKRFGQAVPGSLDITFAGAEANVAAALAGMGADVSFVTALPAHAVADAVVAGLRSLGVDTRQVVRPPSGRLGLLFSEKGINQRPASVIYDRDGSSFSLLPASGYDWEAVFAGAGWFHLSGVTPGISENAARVALQAVREAAGRGLRISFDMNFRSKLWQWEPGTPAPGLAARCVREILPLVDVFFGGPGDIALLTDAPEEEHASAARRLAATYPRLTHVAMTVRETVSASHHRLGGLLHETEQRKLFAAPRQKGNRTAYDIPHIVDRLGGGDAFAGGLIFALTTPELQAPGTAIAFATAASCLAHSTEGDFAFSTREEIESLMTGRAAGRVNR